MKSAAGKYRLSEAVTGGELEAFAIGTPKRAPLKQDADLSRLSELAASVYHTKSALISVFDETTQHVCVATGADITRMPRSDSFCVKLIDGGIDSLVIADARHDERFESNPYVRTEGGIRFYAGVPIRFNGERIGSLCVYDDEPREAAGDIDLDQLNAIADVIASLFHLKYSEERRREIETVIARDEVRHKMALASAKVASWVWNIQTGELEYDEGLVDLLSLEPGEKIDFESSLEAIAVEDRERVRAAVSNAAETGDDYECEFRTASTGAWLLGRGRVFETDEEGQPLLMIGIILDVTENRKNAESMKLLLKELSHRVKNTLAILQSMAVQSLRRSRTTEEFTAAFSGRLQAISAAHGLLSDSDWTQIKLRDLVEVQIKPFRERPESINIVGPDPELGPDVALGLGLIVHELATNAAKHGALSTTSGQVTIRISEANEAGSDYVILDWQEENGPAVTVPDGKGFGSILIQRGLDKVIGSTINIDYAENGVHARIKVPLANLGQ